MIWEPSAAMAIAACTRNHTAKSFFTLITHKFQRNGLFLLDEPKPHSPHSAN